MCVTARRSARWTFGRRARAAVVGFDGGEQRENIMGVCDLPWTFDPGLLTRDWEGADLMVARLAAAVVPPEVALALEFDPVVAAGTRQVISLVARNLGSEPHEIEAVLRADVGQTSRLLFPRQPGNRDGRRTLSPAKTSWWSRTTSRRSSS